MELSDITVLLVDDEPDFLESLARRLTLRKLNVLTAASGLEALEKLRDHQVDVVVLDVRMPGMDGIETLKAIKKDHAGVQVIMLTGHADLEASLKGLELGFFDYLTKPVTIDKLLAKLVTAIEKKGEGGRAAAEPTFESKMKERMMAADRLACVGTLAASIAHEMNNPLAIINEATGWLKSKVAKEPGLSPELRDAFNLALDKTQTSVERARRISRGLLGFARQTDSEIRNTDLGALMAEVRELTKKEASNRGAKVSVVDGDGPIEIQVDPYLLRQVVLNLVTNALDAVAEGGEVEMTVGGDAEYAVIEVNDNGSGIEPENLEHIFEPFYTTKPGDRGTGLGLPVSRSIVEELGGRIEVHSQPGQGATFKVVLPRRPITKPVTGA